MTQSNRAPHKGCFITFEGGEGVGKTTQIDRIGGRLRAEGVTVVQTREPGGTPEGEAIRDLLKNVDLRWSALGETLLNSAARKEHVDRCIGPALLRGDWVLCDRFFDSTTAYQGIVGGIDLELIDRLNRESAGDMVPDLTILLDLDPGRAGERLKARAAAEDRYDLKDHSFHRRLRQAYLRLAEAAPDRFAVVDAGQSVDRVGQEIWQVIRRRLLDPMGLGAGR